MEFFLARIFPHSDWIRRDTKYIQSECGKIRSIKNSVFGHLSSSVNNSTIFDIADSLDEVIFFPAENFCNTALLVTW